MRNIDDCTDMDDLIELAREQAAEIERLNGELATLGEYAKSRDAEVERINAGLARQEPETTTDALFLRRARVDGLVATVGFALCGCTMTNAGFDALEELKRMALEKGH